MARGGVFIRGATAAAPELTSPGTSGQVLTSNGAAADPTFQSGIAFPVGFGLSFDGPAAPITMVGGDDGLGNTAIVFDNLDDLYLTFRFEQYTDVYIPGGLGFAGDSLGIAAPTTIFSPLSVGYDTAAVTGVHQKGIAAGVNYIATGGDPDLDGINVTSSELSFGEGGVAAVGTSTNYAGTTHVRGCGDGLNTHTQMIGVMSVEIGTGYTQSSGPTGRAWVADRQIHGPIAVQPGVLVGDVVLLNNHYNGSPSEFPAAGISIVTKKGVGDGGATHTAADTRPVDVGLRISGVSDVGGVTGIGFTTALQIGGTGSPWGEVASKIGTGLIIRDYATAGININNAGATSAPSILFDTFLETAEMGSAPSAPAANGVRIYAVDNGAGKTQRCSAAALRSRLRFNRNGTHPRTTDRAPTRRPATPGARAHRAMRAEGCRAREERRRDRTTQSGVGGGEAIGLTSRKEERGEW